MEDRHITISITAATIIKTVLFLLLVWFLFTLRSIVLDILTAIVIASAIEPAVVTLRRRKIPRVLCVLIVYVLVLAVFFGIFYFFLPLLFQDMDTFITSIPTYVDQFNHSDLMMQYGQMIGSPTPVGISTNEIIGSVQSVLNAGLFGNSFNAASSIFGGLFSFIIIIVFSFYFAVLETGVDDFLRIIVPKNHQKYILGLWRRSQHKIGLWMQGQLILALLMGVLVFLLLTIFHVPHALVLALIAGVFEIIPVFGPTLSAIPAVAVALGSGGVTLALITVAIYVVVQQFENHLIYPNVVTHVVGVPPLLVILALIIGGELAGFLGIILSVPVAATIQELVRDIENNRLPASEHIV